MKTSFDFNRLDVEYKMFRSDKDKQKFEIYRFVEEHKPLKLFWNLNFADASYLIDFLNDLNTKPESK